MSDAYERLITRNIHRCTRFLLVLSPAAVRSEWVAYEVGQALKARRSIIPLIVRDCDPEALHPGLATIDSLDFRRPSPLAKRKLKQRLLSARYYQIPRLAVHSR